MAGSLTGRTALVTGSTSGIGLAIAEALAAQGAAIALHGLGDAAAIEATRSRLERAYGVPVAVFEGNMAQPAEIEGLVQAVIGRFGAVDVLVNNAGVQHVAPIEQFPPERWDAIIAINLSAAFHTTRLLVAQMRERGWGRIINTASAHGLVASAQKAAYVAAKHGLIGLTKVVALETAGTGVTCNAICPGWVRTELVERQIEALAANGGTNIEDAARVLLAEKQPSMSFVSPEQLGQFAVFLCSDAASQMTGSALSIDGGWTAQ
jgi:3-hydroxybutyrate dehydrogenase